MPVPLRLVVCVLGLALSVTVMVVDRLPVLAGVKVTLMVQLAPADTLDPHVLVRLKSPELPPDVAMLVMLRLALPELVSVTG